MDTNGYCLHPCGRRAEDHAHRDTRRNAYGAATGWRHYRSGRPALDTADAASRPPAVRRDAPLAARGTSSKDTPDRCRVHSGSATTLSTRRDVVGPNNHPTRGRYRPRPAGVDWLGAGECELRPVTRSPRAVALMLRGRWDASLEASQRALELAPYGSRVYQMRAFLLNRMGSPQEAQSFGEKALALDPRSRGRFASSASPTCCWGSTAKRSPPANGRPDWTATLSTSRSSPRPMPTRATSSVRMPHYRRCWRSSQATRSRSSRLGATRAPGVSEAGRALLVRRLAEGRSGGAVTARSSSRPNDWRMARPSCAAPDSSREQRRPSRVTPFGRQREFDATNSCRWQTRPAHAESQLPGAPANSRYRSSYAECRTVGADRSR